MGDKIFIDIYCEIVPYISPDIILYIGTDITQDMVWEFNFGIIDDIALDIVLDSFSYGLFSV